MNFDTLDGPDALRPFSKVCSHCKRKFPTVKHTCEAFPDHIPDAIWDGVNPHTLPFSGDNSLQFVPRVARDKRRRQT
jgi:hypothetical protein